jgi:Type I phosphodiesterase / nucleotide pyrophosphatase
MKPVIISVLLAMIIQSLSGQPPKDKPNIFIITTDGFRWQEIFDGADTALMSCSQYVADTGLIQELYGGATPEIRRQKLLPFFWNVIAQQGQLYGNRHYGNKADVRNFYKISYAGYNEIFTGYADPRFIPNSPRFNTNTNLPGYLNTLPGYKGKCVAFSSWNIFPYILNEQPDNFPVNSGYENFITTDSALSVINMVQDSMENKSACRNDMLTFLMAKQFIQQQHPKCVVLSFGETDEFAHSHRYDMYLQKANNFDNMLAALWYMVQTDPFYKNNTTFVITTDHGRGKKNNTWPAHHLFIKGSGEIWLAMLGHGIERKGEIKDTGQIYQNQIAQTVAGLLGENFITRHPTGQLINLPFLAQKISMPLITTARSAK